jgi:uncharacterized Ntn-hydrolase superfamily protein
VKRPLKIAAGVGYIYIIGNLLAQQMLLRERYDEVQKALEVQSKLMAALAAGLDEEGQKHFNDVVERMEFDLITRDIDASSS